MLYVVKKDGTREIFNVEKIVNAIAQESNTATSDNS